MANSDLSQTSWVGDDGVEMDTRIFLVICVPQRGAVMFDFRDGNSSKPAHDRAGKMLRT